MSRFDFVDLPGGWAATPLKYLTSSSGGMTPSKDRSDFWEGDVPWVSPKDMKRPILDDAEDHITALALQETGIRLHPVDSVLVVTRGMILAHTFPVAMNSVPVTVNQDMKVLRTQAGVSAHYLAWLLQGLQSLMLSLTDESAHGTKALRTDQWANLPVPVPSTSEQERIANFLDEQTARIDQLISEKERLAKLLQAVSWDEVTRAVTVGIAGASRRETGLDWCPAIPKHWKVLLLRRLFLRTEYGISESMSPEGNVAVLRMGNVSDGMVHMTDLKFVDAVEEGLLLRRGDLLYNRTNSLAQVGKVGLVREMPKMPVSFASYLVRLVPNDLALPEYLAYLLNCPDVLAIARSLALPAIGQANLNPTRYGYIHVPCPPIPEQREIVAYLDRKVKAVSELASLALEHTERLREYRSSLISAAVTGQLNLGTFKEAD